MSAASSCAAIRLRSPGRSRASLRRPCRRPQRYGGAPVYCTDIVVRADSRIRGLEDTFGRRFAYTTHDSQSGWQAPRRLFARYAQARGGALFAATIGPLVTPRRVVEAIMAGNADAGPLDSYFHDLLRHHEPTLAARLRTLAWTPLTPIPPLVAAPATPEADVRRLRDALLATGAAEELAGVRAALLLRGFASVPSEAYTTLRDDARATDADGYPRIA